MASMGDLKVDVEVGMTIPDSTVKKCLSILNIWLEDNPNKTLKMNSQESQRDGESRWLEIIDRYKEDFYD